MSSSSSEHMISSRKNTFTRCAPFASVICASIAVADTAVIHVNAAATGSNDGSSWTDAFHDLHDALGAAAEAGGNGVQIWVVTGEYLPGPADEEPQSSFHLVSGVEMYGGFAGWETALDQRDWKANETILRRDAPDFSVFTAAPILVGENLAEGSAVDGFTVRDGYNWSPYGPGSLFLLHSHFLIANCVFVANGTNDEEGGGAILAQASTITILVSKFINNTSAEHGGAIATQDSTLALFECSFLSNDGGIDGGAISGTSSVAFVEKCIFTANHTIFSGEAIYWSGGTLHISGSLIDSNIGGGHAIATDAVPVTLLVEGSVISNNDGGISGGGPGTLQIINSSFINNVSPFNGGGVRISGGLVIDDCIFEGNTSTFSGGAIWLGTGEAVIRSTRILDNTATLIGGGGIYSSGSLTLINCDISGNDPVDLPGGGVYQAAGDLTMINCKVTGNIGEGVRVGSSESPANATIINSTIAHNLLQVYPRSGHLEVLNSIIWDTGGAGSCTGLCGGAPAACYCDELCCEFNDCCLDKFDVCGGCRPEFGTIEVSHSIVQGLPPHDTGDDPMFVDPANDEFRPQLRSPAIDAGDNSFVPDPDEFPGAETDLDGNPRIIDGNNDGIAIVDLGAYEFQPSDSTCIFADLNCDGVVDTADLLLMLLEWGECPSAEPAAKGCAADLNGDGFVNVHDLLLLLGSWTM